MKLVRLTGPLGALSLLVLAATPCLAGGSDVRVVVGFKGSVDNGVVTRHGGSVIESSAGDHVVVATLSASKLSKLRADASVAYVEEDGVVEANGKGSKGGGGGGSTTPTQPTQVVEWGVSTVWSGVQPSPAGGGVKIAIVDTGIDLSHPDLTANIQGDTTFVRRTKSGNDDNGHGTHCAGIAAAADNDIGVVGVAPDASLYAVKVLDARGSGYTSDVARGVDWASSHGMNIVSMSLGSSSNSTTLADSCDAAAANGVLILAAAGNAGDGSTSTNEVSYPAYLESVVSVGSTTSSDTLSSFSNTNADVEVSAPGSSVRSTYKGSTYATLSGTSMATPHAAGAAAVLWSAASSPTADSVRTALQEHVVDLGASGRDNGFGYGRVDLAE